MNTPPIPHSVESEEAVIGAILIDPFVMQDIDFLKPEHFYIHRLRWIYESVLALQKQGTPIDTLTVSEYLDSRGQLVEIGGPAYMVGLVNAVPYTSNVEAYARIIEGHYIRRGFIKSANSIAQFAYDETLEIADIDVKVRKLLEDQARPATNNLQAAQDAADELMSVINSGAKTAMQTYLPALDAAIGGLPLGEVVLIAGDTSAGKTALTLQMAEQLAQNKKKVLYVSMESKAYTLVARRVCGNAGIEQKKLRAGNLTQEEKDNLKTWVDLYKDRVKDWLVFDDESRTVSEIERSIAAQNPYLVIVDHLGEMTSDNENTTRGILENCTDLKALAKKYNTAMVIIHTLSADAAAANEDDVPDINTLGWAKDLRYKVDILLGLYASKISMANGSERRFLWVLKDREGKRYVKVNLYFWPQKQWFSDKLLP